jgi:uncharacterized protein (TIGR02466 family)
MIDLSTLELVQNQCFITSIYEVSLGTGDQIADLNRGLMRAIDAIHEAGEKGRDYAGAGWQTPHDLHERPAFSDFFGVIGGILGEIARGETIPDDQAPVVHSAWSNVQHRGEFVRTHMHPWSAFSGVYYVSAEAAAGDLYFEDPRPGRKALTLPTHAEQNPALMSFTPRPGLLIVFPSFLEHYTDPSQSDVRRICISFNASLGKAHSIPNIGA